MAELKEWLDVDEVARLLDENYHIFCDLENYSNEQLEGYGRSLKVLRERICSREEEVVHLRGELTLRDREIEVLKEELEKVRKIMSTFNQ